MLNIVIVELKVFILRKNQVKNRELFQNYIIQSIYIYKISPVMRFQSLVRYHQIHGHYYFPENNNFDFDYFY